MSGLKAWTYVTSKIHQNQTILFLKYKCLKVERHYQIFLSKGKNWLIVEKK